MSGRYPDVARVDVDPDVTIDLWSEPPRFAVAELAGTTVPAPPVPTVELPIRQARRVGLVVKHGLDRLGALVLLLLTLPVFVTVAAIVWWSSPGPVFFRQTRVGIDGKYFTCLKFRTMVVDAEEQLIDLVPHNDSDGPLFKFRDDPRVTGAGRWLRRFSLDELPSSCTCCSGTCHSSARGPPCPTRSRSTTNTSGGASMSARG